MKFYTTINPINSRVQLVATQAEAKARGVRNPQPFEVPTDKEGLMEFVNKLYNLIDPLDDVPVREPEQEQVANVDPYVPERETIWSAKNVLHDMSNRKETVKRPVSVDEVIETILELDSYPFANVFSAVIERADRIRRDTVK